MQNLVHVAIHAKVLIKATTRLKYWNRVFAKSLPLLAKSNKSKGRRLGCKPRSLVSCRFRVQLECYCNTKTFPVYKQRCIPSAAALDPLPGHPSVPFGSQKDVKGRPSMLMQAFW